MNKIILLGRLIRDPEVRYSQGENPKPIARYSIAVDKRFKRDDGITADYFNLVAFERHAVFAEKYLKKGTRILVSGRVQTGTYENSEGVRIPFFETVVEEQEFAESKAAGSAYVGHEILDKERTGEESQNRNTAASGNHTKRARYGYTDEDGFMTVPDDLGELPFD